MYLNINNYYRLCKILNCRRSSIADYRWKPYIWYALYSWGVPVVLTIIMVIMNYHPGEHPRPGIGLNTCWFYGKYYLNI